MKLAGALEDLQVMVRCSRKQVDSSVSTMVYLENIRTCSGTLVNPLTPNGHYSGRTAPLTSEVAFYIFIQLI